MSNSEAQITRRADAAAYIFAGLPGKSGPRVRLRGRSTDLTFQIKQGKGAWAGTFFVSVQATTDDGLRFLPLGHMDPANLESFRASRASHFKPTDLQFKAWKWFTKHALRCDSKFTDVEVWTSGTCGRCGRALHTPESIKRGLGPNCAAKTDFAFHD